MRSMIFWMLVMRTSPLRWVVLPTLISAYVLLYLFNERSERQKWGDGDAATTNVDFALYMARKLGNIGSQKAWLSIRSFFITNAVAYRTADTRLLTQWNGRSGGKGVVLGLIEVGKVNFFRACFFYYYHDTVLLAGAAHSLSSALLHATRL